MYVGTFRYGPLVTDPFPCRYYHKAAAAVMINVGSS